VAHFLPEVILLTVRWYCRYAFYRDLEEMMQEQGVEVDRSTILSRTIEIPSKSPER
jgi:transposase-like protein